MWLRQSANSRVGVHLDLDDLSLRPGESYRHVYVLEIEPIVQGCVDYEVLLQEGVCLDVHRVAGGFFVNVSAHARVYGPCARCLEETVLELEVEQEEFAPSAKGGWPETELSAFIEGLIVDVSGLAREAVVLAVPSQVLCSPTCKGLCPQCGQNLNKGQCSCHYEEVSDRWAKLRELRFSREDEA